MQTETKQLTVNELALYLGCEAELIWHNTISFTEYKEIRELDLGVLVLAHNYSSIKPILRKLSDITEEEAKELINWKGDTRSKTLDSVNIKNNGIYYEGWAGTISEGLTNPWFRIVKPLESLTPKQFTYLLSKGFDLFGFIEQGLAIEKPCK